MQPHRRQAARRGAGRDGGHGSSASTGSRCSAGSASRTPMRWRCRAQRAAGARHPHARRSRAAARRTLSIAGDYEFFGRPEWAAIRKAYGLVVPRAAADAAGVHVCRRRRSGEVDVIAGYTSDGRIAQYDLVVLDDPKHAIPPYDAVLLVSPQRAERRGAARGAAAAGRRDRRDADARGQPARLGGPREAARWRRASERDAGCRSSEISTARRRR